MPQNENFWNPYRMIPVRDAIERKPPITDERFKGKSGFFHCRLINLTPLFVGGNRYSKQLFLTRNGKHVIPGSSLKGMLRSLVEVLGGGCNVSDPQGKYSHKFKACNQTERLCVACRMFGMMERGSGAKVHRGNIGVSDALLNREHPETQTLEVLLANCSTRHEPFYRSPKSGKLDGQSRKLYFHQPQRTGSVPNVPQNLKSRAWYIDALVPGHQFEFKVQFSNLRKEELAVLAYALDLEEMVQVESGVEQIKLIGPMRHKIGNAKPLGLGSCHIQIQNLVYHAAAAERFARFGGQTDTILEGNALERELTDLKKDHVNDNSETMQQLRKMMVWDENDPRDFRYPDYHWFQNPANAQKTLKEI